MGEPRPCIRCHEAPRQRGHSWCRRCHAAWQQARYVQRAQTEPDFKAANNARTRQSYHRRHPHAGTRRPQGRRHQLPENQRWCWWCQQAHGVEAFLPVPGTTRGYRYSCREGSRIMTALWRSRRRKRAPH